MSQDLISAIKDHDLRRVSILLSQGIDPNAPEFQEVGWRPLHFAINELEDGGDSNVITLLLKHGADVNGWDIHKDVTPLLLAICNDQKQVVEMLLEAGADPTVCNCEGDSPLRVLVEQGDLNTALRLLNTGARKSINEWGGLHGFTALGLAADRLDIAMIELLVRAGADVKAFDADHRVAWERLPVRTSSNGPAWDRALAMLKDKKI